MGAGNIRKGRPIGALCTGSIPVLLFYTNELTYQLLTVNLEHVYHVYATRVRYVELNDLFLSCEQLSVVVKFFRREFCSY